MAAGARNSSMQSLQHDPGFAAAWAERGRLERILGKFEDPSALAEAEASLAAGAWRWIPENGAAQHYYAQLEIDLGRVDAALGRLLDRAWQRRAEPHIYAALVHACRYGGLLDASVAAHRTARRGSIPRCRRACCTPTTCRAISRARSTRRTAAATRSRRALLGAMGRRDEALAAARREEARFAAVPLLRGVFDRPCAPALEGRGDEALEALRLFDDAALQRRRRAVLRGRDLCAARRSGARVRHARRAPSTPASCAVPAFERDVYLAPLAERRRRGARWWPACSGCTCRRVASEFDAARRPAAARAVSGPRVALGRRGARQLPQQPRPWRTSSRASRSRPRCRAPRRFPRRSGRRRSAARRPGSCARPRAASASSASCRATRSGVGRRRRPRRLVERHDGTRPPRFW